MGADRPDDDAVFLIQAGGRILAANENARRVFHLKGKKPLDLERLASRAQPVEAFFALCSEAGSRQFRMDGRLVEGTAVQVPEVEEALTLPLTLPSPGGRGEKRTTSRLLVTLHFPEIIPETKSETERNDQEAVETFARISQGMGASLDLDSTAEAVIRGIEMVLLCEMIVVTVLDKESRTWTPYVLSGLAGVGRNVRKEAAYPSGGVRMTDRLARDLQPIRLAGKADLADVSWPSVTTGDPLQAYLGLPLVAGDDVTGTLELGWFSAQAGKSKAFELASLLAVPAATALRNAALYHAEQRRANLANGLAQLARAAGISHQADELLRRVVEAIAPLMDIDLLGFLLYDKEKRVLTGQAPFHGLPAEFMPLYRLEVKAGGTLETVLHRQEAVSSEDAAEDERWVGLGMDGLARAVGMHDTLLAPVVSAGQMLGYLQASNHRGHPGPFSEEELRILTLATSLVGPTLALEKAALPRTDSKEAPVETAGHEAAPGKDEGRKAAAAMSDSQAARIRDGLEMAVVASRQVEPQAVLATLANEMLILMGPDVVLVAEGTLGGPALTRVLGSIPEDARPETTFGQRNPLRQVFDSREMIEASDLDSDQDWRGTPLLRSLKARGFICLPLVVGGKVIAALLAVFTEPLPPFSDDDRQIYQHLAHQVAIILQNLGLLAETRRRLREVNLLLEFSRQLGSLDQAEIVNTLLTSTLQALPAAGAGMVALWNEATGELIPQIAIGYPDNQSLVEIVYRSDENGETQPLPMQVMLDGYPRRVDEIKFALDYPLPEEDLLRYRQATGGSLPNASLMIPICSGERRLGLLLLDNFTAAGAFSAEDETLAASLVQQSALALDNARIFEESQRRAGELDRRSQRLAVLNRLSSDLGSAHSPEDVLRTACRQMLHALNCSVVSAVLIDSQGQAELQAESPETNARLPLTLPETPLFSRMQSRSGIFNSGDVESDPDLEPLKSFLSARRTCSLLAVPMLAGSEMHGVLMLQTRTAYHFSPLETELALTIGNQTAVALQNARLTRDLELRVQERTAELRREQRNSETLLGVITALSSSLEMEKVLDRTLTLINAATEADQSAIFLYKEGMVEPYFRSTTGRTILAMSNGWIVTLPENELAGQVVRERKTLLIEDLGQDGRWEAPGDRSFPYLGVIGVPLEIGNETLGVLILYQAKGGGFSKGQLSLVEAAARQISVALHNAGLFQLVRDQADNLGEMLHSQQVEASRSRAILEAVADGVLVTDADNEITLLNPAAERNLDLQAAQVVGESLESFSGLFGRSGRTWLNTIHQWSSDPASYQSGETYSDQVTLENGRVIAISLAPVFLEAKFLGTVSIFRDVTIEVKVDRMKSEFVANVSHELRTPMTSIKGYVDLMLMGASGPFNDQQQRFLEVIKNNTRRLNVLVNGLLDVSRIEAGQVSLAYESLDMAEIAHDVIEDLKRRSKDESKTMAFVLDAAPGLPRVEGDALRVRQILTNLATNAYNYTPENGLVTVHIHCEERQLQVDVEDNGVGISKDEQERIFERFYRGEHPLVLATSGTGLGLSIVKTLVEMHHGQIWFSSSGEPGKGTTFSFTLPLHPASEEKG